MHEAGLFLLDAWEPHRPTAFDADGVLRERLWRYGGHRRYASLKDSAAGPAGWAVQEGVSALPAKGSWDRATLTCAGADSAGTSQPTHPGLTGGLFWIMEKPSRQRL